MVKVVGSRAVAGDSVEFLNKTSVKGTVVWRSVGGSLSRHLIGWCHKTWVAGTVKQSLTWSENKPHIKNVTSDQNSNSHCNQEDMLSLPTTATEYGILPNWWSSPMTFFTPAFIVANHFSFVISFSFEKSQKSYGDHYKCMLQEH